jgi:hypothetical protein
VGLNQPFVADLYQVICSTACRRNVGPAAAAGRTENERVLIDASSFD